MEVRPEQTDEEATSIFDFAETPEERRNAGDRAVIGLSGALAWIYPALMIAICAQVVLRQMENNQAWLDDLQWWLYGIAVLVGVSFAVTTNSHVRVDIFFDGYSEQRKARIDVFSLAWCFLPFAIVSWDVSFKYALISVGAWEGSDSPNGLHNLWILKLAVNASFILLIIAIWSRYVSRLSVLCQPTLARQLLFALPGVMLLINLAIYYLFYTYAWITLPEGEPTRKILRHALFDDVEVGPWDIKYTVLITIAVSALLMLACAVSARKGED
jgi:TRAP-type mannitol/chloroaromatic compound transport system permease small subunit